MNPNQKLDKNINQNGYIALISVFIISALTILIASSASLVGIGESNVGLQESQSWGAFYLANLCAEQALMKLKENSNYTGNETLTFENGSCEIYEVLGGGNENREVRVFGSAFGQIRKIRIEINLINPEMQIKSWQEVTKI